MGRGHAAIRIVIGIGIVEAYLEDRDADCIVLVGNLPKEEAHVALREREEDHAAPAQCTLLDRVDHVKGDAGRDLVARALL